MNSTTAHITRSIAVTGQSGDRTEALAAAAAAGDKDALGALYDLHLAPSYRYVLARVGGDVHLAQDLTADTWVAVVKQIRTYRKPDGGRGGWRAWFYTILRNCVADHHRQHGRRKTVPDPDAGLDYIDVLMPDPQVEASRAGLRADVAEALAGLPESYQEVLTARFWLGLSVPETAASLGISTGAVRVRQHRAVKAIGAALPGYTCPW